MTDSTAKGRAIDTNRFPELAPLTNRRAFIGGSDARVIMGNDEAALPRPSHPYRCPGGGSWPVRRLIESASGSRHKSMTGLPARARFRRAQQFGLSCSPTFAQSRSRAAAPLISGAIGIITIIFQIYYRYPVCSGAAGCGLSFGKGVVWSAIWPAYWAIQWNWL
jgi:hypothetical protein